MEPGPPVIAEEILRRRSGDAYQVQSNNAAAKSVTGIMNIPPRLSDSVVLGYVTPDRLGLVDSARRRARAHDFDRMDEAVWKAFQHGDFNDMLDKLAVTTMNFRHLTFIVSTEISDADRYFG